MPLQTPPVKSATVVLAGSRQKAGRPVVGGGRRRRHDGDGSIVSAVEFRNCLGHDVAFLFGGLTVCDYVELEQGPSGGKSALSCAVRLVRGNRQWS